MEFRRVRDGGLCGRKRRAAPGCEIPVCAQHDWFSLTSTFGTPTPWYLVVR